MAKCVYIFTKFNSIQFSSWLDALVIRILKEINVLN